MKAFWRVIKQYIAPFKKYVAGSLLMNILSAVLNIFSFSLMIPILQLLFGINETVYEFIPWDAAVGIREKILNNAYWYVGQFMEAHGGSTTLLVLCLVLTGMTFFKTACNFGASALMVPVRNGVVKRLRVKIYDKILSLPIGFFSQEKKGDIIARMSGDVMEVETSITSSLDILIKDPILLLFYFGALFFVSWELTLFLILFVPAFIFIMGKIGRKLKSASLVAQGLWSDTMAQVEETLGGLRVIKAFVAEKKMSKRFDTVTDAMRKKNNRVATRQASAHPVSEFMGTAMIAIVLWYGGRLILSDSAPIDAATFIFYMAMLYFVIEPIKEFSKASYNIPKGLASMERINKILDSENDIKEAAEPAVLDGFNDSIRFEGVDFFYQDGGKQILKGIDLEIKKGRTIAIVGASGAGKSTLVDLIPRFYETSAGRITIDGKDIRDLSIRSLRSIMGNVNQDPILFNDTIFNNIAFGVEGATMEQVVEAAKIANAHDFIMEKEEGYQTNIGDRGIKLSGGQRQRISIARAILKNPPVLILDEATASLDTESERIVQEALDRLMSSRTTIAIAHRLSTIKNADEIIVMDEGRIVERGRHDDLIALGGYYKKLNDMQSL